MPSSTAHQCSTHGTRHLQGSSLRSTCHARPHGQQSSFPRRVAHKMHTSHRHKPCRLEHFAACTNVLPELRSTGLLTAFKRHDKRCAIGRDATRYSTRNHLCSIITPPTRVHVGYNDVKSIAVGQQLCHGGLKRHVVGEQ